MATEHVQLFYEMMWRLWRRRAPYPIPWWVQQYFRHWSDDYDPGLFDSKEAAFGSNAHYRYWNMIGVKDHHQESLVGQAGEIEPVYDRYALSFFLFEPDSRKLFFPQFVDPGSTEVELTQELEDRYKPVVKTIYKAPNGCQVTATAFAVPSGTSKKSVVIADYQMQFGGAARRGETWMCLAITPVGPTGFFRHDKAMGHRPDDHIASLAFSRRHDFVTVNGHTGPLLAQSPDHFGLYGNGDSHDPDHYLNTNPFQDLSSHGSLNNAETAVDFIGGLCTAVFAWTVPATQNSFSLNVKLPVDDFRGQEELASLRDEDPIALKTANDRFWTDKLQSGLRFTLPPTVSHLADLHKICRANLLMLADNGRIHPGPTIYDDFWIRDSAIEGIAATMAGDHNLAARQFGTHYPESFNQDPHLRIGPASGYGFFGGAAEKAGREWDSNGLALWAIGRFDRFHGSQNEFGAGLYWPCVLEGARWLNVNRSETGILHAGWSAEHVGERNQPHYWDDFWGIAGLYEAAKLAERIGAREVNELWGIYHSLKDATVASIGWALAEQRRRGERETYIPTGPADVGRLDSTIVGTVAYFHPSRLYMRSKLGDEVDLAARMTLETIWSHFVDQGGFRHDAAWNCYGPYLTLQLAHAFLLVGDRDRMDKCLAWTVSNAGYAQVRRMTTSHSLSHQRWDVVLGAWNEQHCYPVSKDFAELPKRWWYMGDIPHGWACAEFMMLLRDILFFEADEDHNPHIYIAAGVMPHWLEDGQSIEVADAPTIFGDGFGYRLRHAKSNHRIDIEITQHPSVSPWYVYGCPYGSSIERVEIDGRTQPVGQSSSVTIPARANRVTIRYQ